MAKRISHPFFYGVVVLTIIWPTVSYFIRGVNHSADAQLTGIRQGAELEMQANQTRYDAQTEAAGITRGGAITAARLHAEEQITRAIGSKLARDIENAMTLRY